MVMKQKFFPYKKYSNMKKYYLVATLILFAQAAFSQYVKLLDFNGIAKDAAHGDISFQTAPIYTEWQN